MRKIITIQLFLLVTFCSHGQTPNFFADESRWVYFTYETSEPGQVWVTSSEEQNIIHGDTAIGGLNYSKLYTTRHTIVEVFHPPQKFHYYDSVGPTFVRYDTLLKRVYYLPAIDSMERLIYDFDLQVGDTTPMQPAFFPTTVVHFIDTVSIFGVSLLKRFFVTDVIQNEIDPRNFILEGIGGSNGLTFYQPEATLLSGGFNMTRLNCFQYADSIYSPTNSNCPFIDFVSGTEQISTDHTLTISPNPTMDIFTVTISEDLLNGRFTLVDCLGRVTATFKLTEINSTAHLNAPGLYFWRVEHEGRLIRTGKVICK